MAGPLVLLMVGLPATATAAEASTTFATMVSESGDYIGGGSNRIWRPGAGSVTVSGSVGGQVTVSVSGGASSSAFRMTFAAPTGETLTTGDYENAERTPFRTAGHPGIDVSGDGRGCNKTQGRFTVLDVAPDLSRLWLVYEQHCEGRDPALFGEVRYNVPGGDSDLLVAPGQIAWPAEYPGVSGRQVPVTLVNTGTAPVTVSDVSIDDGAADFSVQSSSCTTIAVGASCAVYVRFTPSATGERLGTLKVLDSTAAGSHTVALSGRGIPGHTSWTMSSETGDYIGQGQDWSYTPANATITATGHESHVTVLSQGAEGWRADFEPGSTGLLLPGTTFTGATRWGSGGDPTKPALSVTGGSRACNTLTGSFTIHEAEYVEGALQKFSVTFEQHCEGDPPALLGSIAWKADNAAEPIHVRQATNVSISTSRQAYDYGDSAEVVAHLGPTASSRTVSIYATPDGGAKELLVTGPVDDEGNLAVIEPVHERTTFTVEFAGDASTMSARDATEVTVGARVDGVMRGHYATSGDYHLFHVKSRPKLIARVRPNHAGDCVYFRAQRRAGGIWKNLAVSPCLTLDDSSRTGAVLTGTRSVGERLRMRAEWPGDTANTAVRSDWSYARITR